ncbi:cyclic peptide export ABC transporter [Magnetospirillum sulfuroxidans]|uniref:Cyclic peptide export ABC transporter n=1 Tax=Magnetospirillum sulfuroxidans TaxID=611300 RepID=A0ABS5I7C0_9PROT|nr:cyclic peptide export ABC transporter [Magnetospirillum sulfuroxidans]MBR9970327.1 cyclic peptide export ABC transporter [Magnetospirillum sulfuroxidans]
MHILRLLNTGTATGFRRILVVTCLAGLANAGVLGMINQAAEQTALNQPIGTDVLLLYICLAIFFFLADRASLREANRLVQHKLESLRLRIVGKIRSVDLRTLENLGHGEIFATIAQEINHLSQTLPLLVSAAQSAFLLVFCLLYIALLSFWAFLVVGGFIALGLAVFWWRRLSLDQALAQIHGQEAEMLDNLAHFTKGFQEIRLNADKNDALFTRFTQVVDDLQTQVVGIGRKWVVLLQFSNAFLYALVGVVIFILPLFFQGYTDVIYKITAAAIFCVGPVTAITAAAPLYAKADLGLGHVARLERRLSQGRMATPPVLTGSAFSGFSTIACQDLHFAYRDETGEAVFTAGPFDLTLQRGETVFLVGGNGSGKSTAMKLICGLYAADAGAISVDGVVIDADNRQDYRELFAAIFTDFHLFDGLYGLADRDKAEVERLLTRMELNGKVSFADGRFSTTSLSTGQRKRLALIVAMLEDRDVYMFDEWAADQDSHFRDIFYTQLLPELKSRGKTVLAVTHDDRYWSHCDRRLTMDLGVLTAGTRT